MASSVQKYIENDAVLDEMLGLQPQWWQVPIGVFDRGDRRLDAVAAAGRVARDGLRTSTPPGGNLRTDSYGDAQLMVAGRTRTLFIATFSTRASAEAFVVYVQGLMTHQAEIIDNPGR